jgi:N utilization substance protein A
MNGELLAIIDQIERDKGVNKEVLIQAIESALVSAAKKVIHGDKDQVDIKVELDRSTGKMKVFEGDKEITSKDFGRIAAQTAKQVIIQKIREAEKEVIYGEFHGREGEIVSGGVYRFEKGNIIVDLGKTEGFIPKSEQSNKEEFRQGDRIRAYVLEVKKGPKGPQIVLSRTNPNLVRKLFELEVPEIYEGVVEIKSISRQPGERTKIAVWSKDEKVDCVGACVGMRGQRVKNIVSELHGEKIDIIRYSDDIIEYISAALSPAKISEIKLDKENKKAEVIVDDDQLSLAIGRKGQNVRLACILTGWELDIRSKGDKKSKADTDLSILSGIGEKTVILLKDAGFTTLESIAKAEIKQLTQIKGLGKKKAENIIKQASELLKNNKVEKKNPNNNLDKN